MSEKYDVIIIGAGIGGLVCGCYLAKAGLKVLIVEQHSKPGGYCTSFERDGFKFDVGVHYLGSLREDGILTKILIELDLLDKIRFITCDPTDRIITPRRIVFIRKDRNKTKRELISHFPKEKENIESFFNFIINSDFLALVAKLKKITFSDLLDSFFIDSELKSILSIPLGNLGIAPKRAAALVSAVMYEEYIFDGGYYPRGGVQTLPDTLANEFMRMGGKVLFSKRVERILTRNRKVVGVIVEDKESMFAKYVVSNADASSTFSDLLDCVSPETKVANQLEPSPSAYVIYLGLNRKIKITPKHFTTWFFSSYDINSCYTSQLDLLNSRKLDYALCTFSSLAESSLCPKSKDIIRIFVGSKYDDNLDIEENKVRIFKKVINKISTLIPSVEKYIETRIIATPSTFYKFTSNKNGSLFGWSILPSQIDRKIFPSCTSIKNLYLSGHWVTNGIGQGSVSLVALCGRNTARLIIANSK